MALQKILVVLGPPGSGKGTQSVKLAKRMSYEQIVLGDLIREFIKGDSEEAKAARERYDKGIPQPDELATKLLQQKLPTVKTDGAVIDTYPLSVAQAEALDEVGKILGVYDIRIIFINVSKNEVIKRISQRKICSSCKHISLPGQEGYDKNICSNCGKNLIIRSDDTPEVAAARYDEYEKRNAPIKDYYRTKGILIEINGEQTIDEVHHEIAKKMGLDL